MVDTQWACAFCQLLSQGRKGSRVVIVPHQCFPLKNSWQIADHDIIGSLSALAIMIFSVFLML